jgi:hypothetical protein
MTKREMLCMDGRLIPVNESLLLAGPLPVCFLVG